MKLTKFRINYRKGKTLEEGLALAPETWSVFDINRHENGWVFVCAYGIRYVMDDGREGWTADHESIYKELGPRETSVSVWLNKDEGEP